MKRTAKAASKKGFTLIELVVVVAIIGVLAGLLVPTMLDAVTNSRIASAQQTAKVIRDRSAEFFTKMDTQMHTHVGEEHDRRLRRRLGGRRESLEYPAGRVGSRQ